MEPLVRIFDSYNRTARLYPALLALSPLIIGIALITPDVVSSLLLPGSLSVLLVFGGTYLLATLARSQGKLREDALLTTWGGWPTTIVLRHSDDTIDPETKVRYHGLLEAMTGRAMPTKADELLDPKACDHRYRAATTRLMEVRRDPKYRLVHHENASYGFRRNLLGLKPVGIFLCLTAMLVAVAAWQIGPVGDDGISLTLAGWSQPLAMNLLGAFALDLMLGLLWISIVTEGFVRQAANEYALALLRTLDEGTLSQRSAAHPSAVASSSDAGARAMLLSLLKSSRASSGTKLRSKLRRDTSRPNTGKS